MELDDLLKLCSEQAVNVQDDSRKVKQGDIFAAIPGENENGERYITEAIKHGAAYIVCGEGGGNDFDISGACTFVTAKDMRKALAKLAAARWNSARNKAQIIGITGTNGKTTSANMLDFLFGSLGKKCGVLGTIDYRWPGFAMQAPLTTPGSLQLHEMLARMRDANVDYCFMEVSSHALVQDRVAEIPFSGALFTNLTQDHLDFHKDMESYFRAKAPLFLDLPYKDKAMAINQDDAYGRRLLELLPDAVAFGLIRDLSRPRQLTGEIICTDRNGLSLKMTWEGRNWILQSPLVGEFNAMNLLGVQALALALGLEIADLQALENFHGVRGRLERIRNDQRKHVFVDYAHTPDALVNVLQALRKANFKRIITVFGCGGNRDKGKRPLMGEAVAQYSDIAILTSDNPRKEDPLDIMNDVMPGLAKAGKLYTETDRRKATALALELLEEDDALLIAGKGHEDYQIIGENRLHYSDQEVVRELMGCE